MPINLPPPPNFSSHVQGLVACRHTERISTLRFALTVSPCRLAFFPCPPSGMNAKLVKRESCFSSSDRPYMIRRFSTGHSSRVHLSATLACLFANGCGSISVSAFFSTYVAAQPLPTTFGSKGLSHRTCIYGSGCLDYISPSCCMLLAAATHPEELTAPPGAEIETVMAGARSSCSLCLCSNTTFRSYAFVQDISY